MKWPSGILNQLIINNNSFLLVTMSKHGFQTIYHMYIFYIYRKKILAINIFKLLNRRYKRWN